MNSCEISCSVALYTKCNNTTTPFKDATKNATHDATNASTPQSIHVLENSQCNLIHNFSAPNLLPSFAIKATRSNLSRSDMKLLQKHATDQTRMVDTFFRKSCSVAQYSEDNYATQLNAFILRVIIPTLYARASWGMDRKYIKQEVYCTLKSYLQFSWFRKNS